MESKGKISRGLSGTQRWRKVPWREGGDPRERPENLHIGGIWGREKGSPELRLGRDSTFLKPAGDFVRGKREAAVPPRGLENKEIIKREIAT